MSADVMVAVEGVAGIEEQNEERTAQLRSI